MSLTHKEAQDFCNKLWEEFNEVALNGAFGAPSTYIALSKSVLDENGKAPANLNVKPEDRAFSLDILTEKEVPKEQQSLIREAANKFFGRKTDDSDVKFRVMGPIRYHSR